MRRYRIVCEVYEDDQLIRRMEEFREKLVDDYSDGEETVGYLLSFVPGWIAAETGCSGVATVAKMCSMMPEEHFRSWVALGKAYGRWEALHDFDECVKVTVDEDSLDCNSDDECPLCRLQRLIEPSEA